jgi:hypothetical protein
MPVHDWTRVDAGTLHAFHTAWITHLSEALNNGLLPSGYYALPEQHGGRLIADILTLQAPPSASPEATETGGGLAVADAPPRVRHKLSPSPAARASRRTLTIRHASGHRIVAIGEIVSPANKDRASHVADFVEKLESALWHGVHCLLADLLPPGAHDPSGMHAALWERFDDEPYTPSKTEPLTLASYAADTPPQAYIEPRRVGAVLPEMPLFLTIDRYINLPLESTYSTAFRGLPAIWREALEVV